EAGDLILIDCDGTKPGRPKFSARADSHAADVQLALLNLVERPVVMRLPRNQASLARILELLGQPAALGEQIHVLGPRRREDRRASDASSTSAILLSGSVLVFPAHGVRKASWPPLPEPIGLSQPSTNVARTTDGPTSRGNSLSLTPSAGVVRLPG